MYQRFLKPSKSQSFFLFGPRGSGKSTLLKHYFEGQKTLWIDLLSQRLEFELAQNPDLLLDRWKINREPWIVIDEVQKIPKLLDIVHQGIESHRIKFALTGSSARKLKRGQANLLAGRAASLFLSPFSSLELGSDFDLTKALKFGLLPKFWSEEKLPHPEIVRSLYSYVNSYLKEEVAAEQLVRNLEPFRRFLVAAAQSNGKILNYSNIEKDSGISHSQAERHFEILCDTLIGRYLPPYDKSIRKRQAKKSKFYFFDTGVVRTLTHLADETLNESTYEYGDLFETFLINEFFKLQESLEKPWQFSFFKTKDDVEIDLIIEKPRGKPILIEIKSSSKITEKQLSPFANITKEFKNSEKYLLSRDPIEKEVNGIQCLPWNKGLKIIFEKDQVT